MHRHIYLAINQVVLLSNHVRLSLVQCPKIYLKLVDLTIKIDNNCPKTRFSFWLQH